MSATHTQMWTIKYCNEWLNRINREELFHQSIYTTRAIWRNKMEIIIDYCCSLNCLCIECNAVRSFICFLHFYPLRQCQMDFAVSMGSARNCNCPSNVIEFWIHLLEKCIIYMNLWIFFCFVFLVPSIPTFQRNL